MERKPLEVSQRLSLECGSLPPLFTTGGTPSVLRQRRLAAAIARIAPPLECSLSSGVGLANEPRTSGRLDVFNVHECSSIVGGG